MYIRQIIDCCPLDLFQIYINLLHNARSSWNSNLELTGGVGLGEA